MSEDKHGSNKGPFIPTELRPPVGSDLEQDPPEVWKMIFARSPDADWTVGCLVSAQLSAGEAT